MPCRKWKRDLSTHCGSRLFSFVFFQGRDHRLHAQLAGQSVKPVRTAAHSNFNPNTGGPIPELCF